MLKWSIVRYVLLLLTFLIMAGCGPSLEELNTLTPAECQVLGVDVPDGSEPTGIIVDTKHTVNFPIIGMEKYCGDVKASGCVTDADNPGPDNWPAENGRYFVVFNDVKCTPKHEACHALFETWSHTVTLNLRLFQGVVLAECMDNRDK